MKYEQLVTTIIECIKQFNTITHSVDTHAEEFLKKIKNDNERVFIKQVFYGVQRYEEFLKVFTTALFSANPASTNRNDGTLYQIFLYLILFRMEELPYEEFKKLLLSQDAVKMNVMLQFLFDLEKINTFVKDGWCQILDFTYIEEKIISGLEEKATGKRSELIQEVRSEDSQSQSQNLTDTQFTRKKQTTQCKPFNLRQPKPRALPEPILISKNVKANPIPQTTYKGTYHQVKEKNEERLQQTKKQTVEKYKNSAIQRFDFQTEKRPTNIEKITEEVEEELSKKLQFNKKYHQKLPKFNEKTAEVRLNVAMILKEENKLKKVQEEEAKILMDYEINMRDSSEFNEWRKKQQEIEDHQKLERLNQSQQQQYYYFLEKIEMELAREAANKAMQEKYEENHQIATEMKQITKEKLIEKEEKNQDDLKTKKKLIAGVLETRENGQIEKQKLVVKNKDKHDQNKQEIKDALDKRKVEDQIEFKKKQELIKQIRDLELQPRERTKGYDPTETMGYGLLDEMSLFELRERYEQLKLERKEEREQRRLEHLSKKDQKLAEIQSKVGKISQYRTELSKIKEEERKEKQRKKAEENRLKEEIRQQQRLEVYNKIVHKKKDKKEEEDKLAKELREIRIKRQFLNANEAMVEAKAWKSLQDGAEREILDRQNNKLIHHEKIEAINFKEKKLQAISAKNEVDSLIGFLQDFDERFEIANKENEILHRQIREDYEKGYQTIKNFEVQHTKNMEERDTYKTKISEQSLSTAKQIQSKKAQKAKKKDKDENFSLPPARYAPIQEEQEEPEN